jgi:hypothetical protein
MGGKEDSNESVTEECVRGGGPLGDAISLSSVTTESKLIFGGCFGGGGGPFEAIFSRDASKEGGAVGG